MPSYNIYMFYTHLPQIFAAQGPCAPRHMAPRLLYMYGQIIYKVKNLIFLYRS